MTTADMLARLVSFDTTSRNSNLELITFVRAWLDAAGVTYRVSQDPSRRKANIHAVIGPGGAGGLALSGHVDTVPVDGQVWTADPFELRPANGRLHGRGACDMKGFVASMLAAVPMLIRRKLARPLHLFITYDEETDMGGARRLIADMEASGLRPDLCVVGEPSLMQPIVAHKGRLALRVTVRGRDGHSSQPHRGVNAVTAAARAVTWIDDEAKRISQEGPFAADFDPPHTTLHVGTIAGGTILNIIPARAEFTMEWRTLPQDDADAHLAQLQAHIATALEPAMRRLDPACGFAYEVIDHVPAMELDEDHELATMTRAASGNNGGGRVSYATEGGLYQQAGIPTIVCGPGSVEQAHRPDEWVAQAQLDACDAFIQRLADRLAA
jgi:acetylornithine deacetylase